MVGMWQKCVSKKKIDIYKKKYQALLVRACRRVFLEDSSTGPDKQMT